MTKSNETSRAPERLVHMYMQDWFPSTNGTGTNNRIFSNLRAYLDLGYRVEVVCFQRRSDFRFEPLQELDRVEWTLVKPKVVNSLFEKISYVANLDEQRALNYRFKTRKAIREQVEIRIGMNPGAIHHFEYLATACAYIDLPKCKAIWSMHDLESKFAKAHQQIRSELSNGRSYAWEGRAAKHQRSAEEKAARQSVLTLCIAKHERDFLRETWKCPHAEFFPMSIPDEGVPERRHPLGESEKLVMLHLGRIDSLPSYRSLEFLFTKIFPLLPYEVTEGIEFLIVGEQRESPKAMRIVELGNRFPFVRFLGFQEDLKKQYAEADLQLVGSTEATGLRTRIIESFAYKVPVLSTTIGAEGVNGLENGENIFLSDTPESYSSMVEKLSHDRSLLTSVAEGGRRLYDSEYSRGAVAQRLDHLLQTYFD